MTFFLKPLLLYIIIMQFICNLQNNEFMCKFAKYHVTCKNDRNKKTSDEIFEFSIYFYTFV